MRAALCVVALVLLASCNWYGNLFSSNNCPSGTEQWLCAWAGCICGDVNCGCCGPCDGGAGLLRYPYCAATLMDAWVQFEQQFPAPRAGVSLDCKKADRAPPGLHPETNGGVCMCDSGGAGGGSDVGAGGGSDVGVGGSFGDGVGGSSDIGGVGAGPSSSDVGVGAGAGPGASSTSDAAAVGAGAGSSLPPRGWGGAGGAW